MHVDNKLGSKSGVAVVGIHILLLAVSLANEMLNHMHDLYIYDIPAFTQICAIIINCRVLVL